MRIRAMLAAALLAVIPLRAQELTPAESLSLSYRNNQALADLFAFYGDVRAVAYFQGRADAFADAFFIVTGTAIR